MSGTRGGAVVDRHDVAGQKRVTDAADVVIVGTGVGGATAARVLAEAGLDVVLVEEGPKVPEQGFRRDAYSAFKLLWRDLGFQVAEGRGFIPVLQGRAIGGTTVINGAIIHRLPEKIHASWTTEGAIDDRLSLGELERVYDTMDEELGVAPAPDEVFGQNNALMEQGVAGTGATGNRIQRNVRGCQGSARCTQGCPTGRKQSMHLSYVPRAVAKGARVYATCRVQRVTARGGRAAGVRGRFRDPVTGEAGPELEVEARRAVVVAASAVQTPVLLSASGVGRRSGQVGRRFQSHPGTSVMGVFDEPVNMWFGATQGYECTHYWDERMKFESVSVPLEIAMARVPGYGAALARRVADLGHVAQWGVQVRAETHGRVRGRPQGRPKITYSMLDADVARFKTGVRRLIEMMFAAGAREVYPGVYGLPERLTSVDQAQLLDAIPNDPKRFHFIMAHLFGTAVMHPDPSRGVVGPDAQSHELPGLYVLDSSIFPTNMGVNPQHTIGAIAWLLSESLAGG
ncbi:MAG: GMC family oxidoreductase N-terminal domain-containing protein [Myxococcota bacterium]